jgi:hypothetical protein
MNQNLAHLYSSGAVQRQCSRKLGMVDLVGDVVEGEVAGINKATQRAVFKTMRTRVIKDQAEVAIVAESLRQTQTSVTRVRPDANNDPCSTIQVAGQQWGQWS